MFLPVHVCNCLLAPVSVLTFIFGLNKWIFFPLFCLTRLNYFYFLQPTTQTKHTRRPCCFTVIHLVAEELVSTTHPASLSPPHDLHHMEHGTLQASQFSPSPLYRLTLWCSFYTPPLINYLSFLFLKYFMAWCVHQQRAPSSQLCSISHRINCFPSAF